MGLKKYVRSGLVRIFKINRDKHNSTLNWFRTSKFLTCLQSDYAVLMDCHKVGMC